MIPRAGLPLPGFLSSRTSRTHCTRRHGIQCRSRKTASTLLTGTRWPKSRRLPPGCRKRGKPNRKESTSCTVRRRRGWRTTGRRSITKTWPTRSEPPGARRPRARRQRSRQGFTDRIRLRRSTRRNPPLRRSPQRLRLPRWRKKRRWKRVLQRSIRPRP